MKTRKTGTTRPSKISNGSSDLGARESFRDIADLLPLAVFEIDSDGKFTYVNSRAFEWYGFTREDLERGIGAADVLIPADRERVLQAVRLVLSGSTSGGNEYTALRKDGTTFPIVIYSSAVIRDGRAVGIRGIAVDIADRKRVEEAQRESEELFRNIVEKSDNVFYVHSVDHTLTYLSPQVERILGYNPEEALLRWTDLATDNPINERGYEFTEKAIETGERQPPYELELFAKDGRRVWCEVNEAPLVQGGKTIAVVGAVRDVTERRQARQELQKLGAIVRCSSDLVNMATLEGRMVFLNEAGADMLGIEPSEVENHHILDVIPDEYRDLVRTNVIAALLKGGRWEGDLQYRNIRTGELTDVHVLAFAILDPSSGVPLYFANVSRDIGARKRAEETLRERQARLDSIIRAAPTGIGTVLNRKIIEVNDRICEMTGYLREELVGRSSRVLYMTDQEFEYVGHEKYRQIALNGVGSVETCWRRKDGSVLDVLISSAPLVVGDASGYVTFTALDITERRRAEQALRASEKRYRQLIETLQEGIWVIDEGARTTFVNPRMAEMLGLTVEEMLGRQLHSFVDEGDIEEMEMRERHRRQGMRERYDFEFIRKDGSRLSASLAVSPLVNENGEYIGAIAGVQDNTERKRADEERRRLEAQVRQTQKLESLGVLAGGIAHDFNNILMAIHGNLEFATANLPPDSPARESLGEMDRASKRAADLCKQLLAYSGKGRFAIGALNVGKVIGEMAEMLAVSVSKKAVFRLDVEPDLPPVEADETQMQQVVMNLIVNASEALGEDAGTIMVSAGSVECDRICLRGMLLGERLSEGRYVYLEVADTGCGMDEETLAKIFDPFFTTKFTGRGLGLPTVLGIVRGHRGAISVRSKKGAGTTFRVVFPASMREAERIIEAPVQSGDWQGSGTVLLVDDEEMVRSVAKRMLEHLGFGVFLAADGAEAIEVFRSWQQSIACVVLDLTMPRMDGVETLAALRAISGDVPVILSSGYSEHDISKRFADRGFAGFIEKPYRLATLEDKIRSALGARMHRVVEE